MTTLVIEGQPVHLDAGDLIKTGGEGMVFRWGHRAVKVYHRPARLHQDKLSAFFHSGLDRRLPQAVLAPQAVATDVQGVTVGYAMARLPDDARPFRHLSQPLTVAQNGWDAALAVALLRQVHRTLTRLHAQGVIVGDLNDGNLFFNVDQSSVRDAPRCRSYWVDADSFQIAGYPCPVALDAFLDPRLYGVANLGARPSFSPATDWYAFSVLAVKLLLLTHPYGGTHPGLKTLPARARAGVSVLAPVVNYPASARPPTALSDSLLQHIQRTFEGRMRDALPLSVLESYVQSLVRCSQCGLSYPRERSACPGCLARRQVRPAELSAGRMRARKLLETDGSLINVAVSNSGQIRAIIWRAGEYALVHGGPGGMTDTTRLFSGDSGYRFAFFGEQLVVNRQGSDRLVVFRLSSTGPGFEVALTSARFGGQAVMAGAQSALYRIAGNTIMRGGFMGNHWVEEIAGDARREQTQLWASEGSDLVVGCYRLFSKHYFFLLTPTRGSLPVTVPDTPPLVDCHAMTGPSGAALLLRARQGGQALVWTVLVDRQGHTNASWLCEEEESSVWGTLAGKALDGRAVLHATDAGILRETEHGRKLLGGSQALASRGDALWTHPRGVVVQKATQLWFVEPA